MIRTPGMLEVNRVRAALARSWQAARRVSPRTILLAGLAVFVLYGFPGYMSNDSCDQLLQARSLVFSDAHPPVMAAEWALLDAIIAGPLLMLVVQGALFVWGLAALLRGIARPRAAALLAVALLLFPPVLTTMAVIWKDSQMAGFLLAGAALISTPRRGYRVAGVCMLVVATAMRYNAAAAVLPLLLFWWDGRTRPWRRYLVSFAAWAVLTIAAFGLNRGFTEQQDHAWQLSLAMFDIVGTIRYSEDYQDADIARDLAGTPLVVHDDIARRCRAIYSPDRHAITHGDQRIFDAPSASQLEAIAASWKAVIAGHPRAYLRHRLTLFGAVLAVARPLDWPVWRKFTVGPQAELVHVATQHSTLQRHWMAVVLLLGATWLFRPRFYALVLVGMLPLCRSRLGRAVMLSGLLYELGLFFIAPSIDFRYSHWMIVSTVVGVVLTFRSRLPP